MYGIGGNNQSKYKLLIDNISMMVPGFLSTDDADNGNDEDEICKNHLLLSLI